MTPDTWDALPWHQTRALLEGLADEGTLNRNGGEQPFEDSTSADSFDSGFATEDVTVGV
jgi:hypothetical protein